MPRRHCLGFGIHSTLSPVHLIRIYSLLSHTYFKLGSNYEKYDMLIFKNNLDLLETLRMIHFNIIVVIVKPPHTICRSLI